MEKSFFLSSLMSFPFSEEKKIHCERIEVSLKNKNAFKKTEFGTLKPFFNNTFL